MTCIARAILFVVLLIPAYGRADSTCSADNDFGDTCSISCPDGEAAQCTDGGESRLPECECIDDDNDENDQKVSFFPIPYPALSGGVSDNDPKLQSTGNEQEFNQLLETETNIEDVIQAKLNSLNDYHLRDHCQKEVVGRKCETNHDPCFVQIPDTTRPYLPASFCYRRPICYDETANVCRKVMGKLTLTEGVTIVGEPKVVVERSEVKALPQAAMVMTTHFTNCSAEKQSYTFKHDEETRTGVLYSNTDTLSTKNDLSIQANVGFDVKYIESGLTVKRGISKTVQASKRRDESDYITKSFSFAEPIKVSEWTKSISEHIFLKQYAMVPYEGFAEIDSPIAANKAGITKLSDVYPDPKDRTFKFRGVIRVEYMAENRLSVLTEKLPKEKCDTQYLKRNDVPSVRTGDQI